MNSLLELKAEVDYPEGSGRVVASISVTSTVGVARPLFSFSNVHRVGMNEISPFTVRTEGNIPICLSFEVEPSASNGVSPLPSSLSTAGSESGSMKTIRSVDTRESMSCFEVTPKTVTVVPGV